MDYLDVRIKELASDTEQHLLRSSQPYGFVGLVRRLRSGKLGWVFWATWLLHLVLLVVAILYGIRFFGATETPELVKSGLTAATALIVSVQLFTGLAPHLHAERVLRNLKRIEILVLARREND